MIGEPLNMKTFSTGKFGPKRVSSTVIHEKKTYKAHLYELFVYLHGLFVRYKQYFLLSYNYYFALLKAFYGICEQRRLKGTCASSIIIEFIKLVSK